MVTKRNMEEHQRASLSKHAFAAQVTSPCDGWIVYAGEFRSYGQLLIMNAGGGYHVLMAGLSQIDVQPGQFVLASEPVGTMSGAPRTAQLAVQQTAADRVRRPRNLARR